MTENNSENSLFQNPDGNGPYPTQAQRALELEARLPQTGWRLYLGFYLSFSLLPKPTHIVREAARNFLNPLLG